MKTLLAVLLALSIMPVHADAPAPLKIPAFELPYSSFASNEANTIAARQATEKSPEFGADIAAARTFYGKFNDDRLAEMDRAFHTRVEQKMLGGVPVAVVTPESGVSHINRKRVLINLHGGAFMWGAGSGALIEAIPISAVAKIAVVTVDYRLAPENKFPAASEDVAAVYQELLKKYQPQNIGIYGCSAGGGLAAQAIAWFRSHHLPRPGAIGTFCATASRFGGDGVYVGTATTGGTPPPATVELAMPTPYLAGVSISDPLAFPAESDAVLACFPPTLLITGSRDFASSMLTTTHRRLVALGVPAELFVFDGLWHAFFMYPDLPESREVYRITAKFFEHHLGKRLHTCGA